MQLTCDDISSMGNGANESKGKQVERDLAQRSRKRVRIGALALDTLTFDEAVAWIFHTIEAHRNGPPTRICCPNAAIVAQADQDPAFAEFVRDTELVVADGLPLVWAASLLGTPLGGQIRGVDLMEAICAAMAVKQFSVYILGGLPGAAEQAAQRLAVRNPGLRIAGVDCPAFGFEIDLKINRGVRDRIIAAAPDFLTVALGSPKQEQWIAANYHDLPVAVIQGVGAAIDTVAGLRPRPPAWMGRIGLEWFGRLLNEPGRLWRRYLFGNARFLAIVFRQWLRQRIRRASL